MTTGNNKANDKAPKIWPRRYEKGERRRKHVGRTDQAEFVRSSDRPNEWVGLCPNNIPDEDRDCVLNAAVPVSNGDRNLIPPKRLYAVYKGVIYKAETTDIGKSYHAYPYRGKLSGSLIGKLQEMAKKSNCESEFLKFCGKYIERHGR